MTLVLTKRLSRLAAASALARAVEPRPALQPSRAAHGGAVATKTQLLELKAE